MLKSIIQLNTNFHSILKSRMQRAARHIIQLTTPSEKLTATGKLVTRKKKFNIKSRFSSQSPESDGIVPDVIVEPSPEGKWQVILNIDEPRKQTINYRKLADTHTDSAKNPGKSGWRIPNLNKNHHTLLRVAKAIVAHQKNFLLYGEQEMRPLIQQDLANELGMHESTICRAINEKYIHTPRGNYELKYFFSTGLPGRDGTLKSATAIRAMIKEMIMDEQPGKPLSDVAVTQNLKTNGIHIARRTVTKYREELHIPSCLTRKHIKSSATSKV